MSHANRKATKELTSRTRREPTGELMENEIVRQAESYRFSARTRREPPGELMEEGRRQAIARGANFPTSAREPQTSHQRTSRPAWNTSQPSLARSSREDRREILYQSHRDFLDLPMPQDILKSASFKSQPRRNPQEEHQDTRRISIVSTTSSIPSFVTNDRKRSLTELRTADKISFFGRLKIFIKALAHEGIKLELPFLVLDHLAINELNFKQLIFRVRRCASNGREVENDGLMLFKLRAMDTDAKEGLPSEEWMVILNCDEPEGNHAIYKSQRFFCLCLEFEHRQRKQFFSIKFIFLPSRL